MYSSITNEFNEYHSNSGSTLQDSLREFASCGGLTLGDLAVLVAERPGLRSIEFLSVAEVVLQQVHSTGRPVVYDQFYSHLEFVVKAVRGFSGDGKQYSFAELHGMASVRARENGATIAPYQTALAYAKRRLGWTK